MGSPGSKRQLLRLGVYSPAVRHLGSGTGHAEARSEAELQRPRGRRFGSIPATNREEPARGQIHEIPSLGGAKIVPHIQQIGTVG